MKREKKEKSRAALIIDGIIEPEDNEKYLLNLRKRKPFDQWDKEELHAVAVKGGEAVQVLHGEKKTAKQSLEKILTLKIDDEMIEAANIPPEIIKKVRRATPEATIYDLIQAVAVGKALDGSMKAYELVRDTHGDKPIERVEVTENVTTDDDRALMRSIAARLENADTIQVIKDIRSDQDTEN
jgi:hypothetical protein